MSTTLTLVAVAFLGVAAPHVAGATTVALPDTGLFAPVAAQYAARAPERTRRAAPTDDAARAVAALDVQDFVAARGLVARLDGRDDPRARAVRLRWAVVRDAAVEVDSLTRARLATHGDTAAVPELLAAGQLAFDRLDNARAESLFTRALAAANASSAGGAREARRAQSDAHVGRALVLQKRREWTRSRDELVQALALESTPHALETLANTLVRLGDTDEAITCCEWGVCLDPDDAPCHYWLGNGYARKNYTQLLAAYPRAFADRAGKAVLAKADAALADGRRDAARALYAQAIAAHPGWVDARVRLASLDFEEGRFAVARTGAVHALATCPEYGRAHAVLAKALESQRFDVDVHRADYERRFAAAPTPDVPGIERFVVNWQSLTPRHKKRVAMSMAPWKAFVPVLVQGGATFYVKPLYMLLGDCPNAEALRDQRISYDSRLWDDVRGAGGYHTITGIEDVERTIFDRYNTVTHEFTHQVHGVLPADDARQIQELYRRAKSRDDATHDGFLSRYAGESVYEYFAEGANALVSPRRDAYDPREIVHERLDAMDPALEALVMNLQARTDVHASAPVAFAAGGDDRVSRGRMDEALMLYAQGLALAPAEETVNIAYANALVLGGKAAAAESVATRVVAAHPASGAARTALADARWQAGRGLAAARAGLAAARDSVRAEDRYLVDLALGDQAWVAGDTAAAFAAYDSVLAYQADNPEGLRGRASALALAGRFDAAFAEYDRAVRARTGEADLRCAYARDLIRGGHVAEARKQLDAAQLLDAKNPTAEALRGWADLADAHGGPRGLAAAEWHARQALVWGPWCDLARLVVGAAAERRGDPAGAKRALAPVRERIAHAAPPEYVFRPEIAVWERVHVLPAAERRAFGM